MGAPPKQTDKDSDGVADVLGMAAENSEQSDDETDESYLPSFGRGQFSLSRQSLVHTDCVVPRHGHSPCSELLNFGEVEFTEALPALAPRQLVLDLWSTDRNAPQRNSRHYVPSSQKQQQHRGISTAAHQGVTLVNGDSEKFDEVQPFVLDSEFDYDHVILTPKFSSSDK